MNFYYRLIFGSVAPLNALRRNKHSRPFVEQIPETIYQEKCDQELSIQWKNAAITPGYGFGTEDCSIIYWVYPEQIFSSSMDVWELRANLKLDIGKNLLYAVHPITVSKRVIQ